MPEDTPAGAAAPDAAAPPAAAPPTTPATDPQAPTTPPPGMNQAERDSINADARRVAERGVKDEIDAKDAKLAEYVAADEARKLADMDEVEKANALATAATEREATAVRERDEFAVRAEQEQRASTISRHIAASPTRVPPAYLPLVNAVIADGDVTQETVDTALAQADERWKADATSFGLSVPPAAKDIGSPGAPAAAPPAQGADPAGVEADKVQLAERMQRGEPAAFVEAAEKYGI